MGLIALFDKSFLQALSIDESVWFDQFFTPVVCPIFFVETLADLAKVPKGGKSAESEVRAIASKFPEMRGSPCIDHIQLCQRNILGAEVTMNGCIPLGGGRLVKGGNRLGYVFDQSPEEAAFQRWQAEQFYDVERLFAARWRAELEELDLKQIAKSIRTLGLDGKACRSLKDAKEAARSVVVRTDKPFESLRLAVRFFDIPQQAHSQVIEDWKSKGSPSLEVYAPYTAFVLTIELFFQISLASNLISTERPSNRTDIAYLFYLPFCKVFVSSDKFHRLIAPLFLRNDQEFVWGLELKSDLKKLNDHYLKLSDAERNLGLMSFADRPPTAGDFLVTRLWEKHLRPSALDEGNVSNALSSENERKLVEQLIAFTEGPDAPSDQTIADESEIEAIAIQRRVRGKRGSWWQVPKGLPADEQP